MKSNSIFILLLMFISSLEKTTYSESQMKIIREIESIDTSRRYYENKFLIGVPIIDSKYIVYSKNDKIIKVNYLSRVLKEEEILSYDQILYGKINIRGRKIILSSKNTCVNFLAYDIEGKLAVENSSMDFSSNINSVTYLKENNMLGIIFTKKVYIYNFDYSSKYSEVIDSKNPKEIFETKTEIEQIFEINKKLFATKEINGVLTIWKLVRENYWDRKEYSQFFEGKRVPEYSLASKINDEGNRLVYTRDNTVYLINLETNVIQQQYKLNYDICSILYLGNDKVLIGDIKGNIGLIGIVYDRIKLFDTITISNKEIIKMGCDQTDSCGDLVAVYDSEYKIFVIDLYGKSTFRNYDL